MIKKLTAKDYLFMIAAFASLIFSEISWFRGDRESALFTGLWVPSILCFAIYLKLITKSPNE
jgi:hypothetical protein